MNKNISQRWNYFVVRNKKSGGYLLKKIIMQKIYKFARAVLILGLSFLILQPLLNKLSVSFMEERDLYDPTIIVVPRHFTLNNYKIVTYLLDFWKVLGHTLGLSLLASILQVACCTLVGYGFARFKFPLKKFWFACVILVIVVPPQTIISSLYLNFRFFDVFGIIKAITGSTINLQNSIIPYILLCMTGMGLKSGLYIFLIRQYFRGIPKELEEAAYVDGCGNLQTFIRIMLPDATPILTSCLLFAFVWQWTDSFYARIFLKGTTLLATELPTITSRLTEYIVSTTGSGKASTAYGLAMISTGMIMTIIPLLLIYVIAQKGFVESLSQTGLKM
jgi:multiple sugar transport system permease protein